MSRSAWLALALAVVCVSFGSVFVRLAAAPPLAVAFWRVGLASLIVAPFGWSSLRSIRSISTGPQQLALLGSGIALALHFASWIASLSHTSVATSVLVVNTAPLFTAALAAAILREPLTRSTGVALALGLSGCLLVARGDWTGEVGSLRGLVLALAGALTLSLHHIAGRGLRSMPLSLPGYVLAVWSVAAVALLPLALLSGSPLLAPSPRTWLFLGLLALVPTVGGHGLVNLSLRRLPAPTVGLFLLGEPLGATTLAVLFFGEVPGPWVLAGAALVVSALAVTILSHDRA